MKFNVLSLNRAYCMEIPRFTISFLRSWFFFFYTATFSSGLQYEGFNTNATCSPQNENLLFFKIIKLQHKIYIFKKKENKIMIIKRFFSSLLWLNMNFGKHFLTVTSTDETGRTKTGFFFVIFLKETKQ